MLRRLLKPWFVYQPTRLARRAVAGVRTPHPGYAPLATSWGGRVVADPTRTIGRSIVTTGVYDLAVSEALARLVSPGDTVADAGANVGYMTVLAGVLAGPGGAVLAFEPHPDLFPVLQRNAAALGPLGGAPVELRQAAVGAAVGTVLLQVPPGFGANDGIAAVGPAGVPGGRTVAVAAVTLDEALAGRPAAVLKMDVEGYEPQVLRGAAAALAGRRIRHVLFEDHAIADSEAAGLLRDAGYRLFALGWSLRGPRAEPAEGGSLAARYEAPNYIATLAPDEVLGRLRPRGWRVLRRLTRAAGS